MKVSFAVAMLISNTSSVKIGSTMPQLPSGHDLANVVAGGLKEGERDVLNEIASTRPDCWWDWVCND